MSGSANPFGTVAASQASKEVTVNTALNALSPAGIFGLKANSLLSWTSWGGTMTINGILTQIADQTVTLAASSTCYLESSPAGVVSFNTTAFTPGSTPLYTIVTGASTVTSYVDQRVYAVRYAFLSKSMAAGGTITATQAEAACNIVEATGVLPNNTTYVVPAVPGQIQIDNLTTGGFTLTIKTPLGTGVTVASGTQLLYCNGTNIEYANTAIVNFAPAETPTGAINGTNATYTLAHTPIGKITYSVNGVIQEEGYDFIITGNTITKLGSPSALLITGDRHRVQEYRI